VLRIGLTGGIACGKSLVAALFRECGVPVVNDDDAARDAMAPGSPALAAVAAEFGSEILLPDGSLDRPALGRRVFADNDLRLRLMAITFPAIGRLVGERLDAAERSGAAMVVYESALLFENGATGSWRPIIVVRASPEQQLARLRARNGLTEREAIDRIRSQMSVEEKAARADIVFDNSGSEDDARQRFAALFAELEKGSAGA
jgi:dephospho-CoA kinase